MKYPAGGRSGPILLALALAAALVWVVLARGDKPVLTDDERDYAQAAIHLARSGTFSHASGPGPPVPDAYREPATAALVAVAWRVTGLEIPRTPDELVTGSPQSRSAVRAARVALRLAVVLAALGAAQATRRLGGRGAAAALAFGLTVVSPALGRSSDLIASEPLAAALATLLAVRLAALATDPTPLQASIAGAAAGALALVRASYLPVGIVLALLVPLLATGEPRSRRLRLGLAFGAAVLLLPGLWMARNGWLLGHAVLSDRGGHVLYSRVEVAADLAREGFEPAFLAWTPARFAEERLAERFPDSRFSAWKWGAGGAAGNHYVRALSRRQTLVAELGDALAADRRLRDEALSRLVAAPGRYLGAAVPVAWRSLFVERSPSWTRPFEVALPLGLLLAIAFVSALGRAASRRDAVALAVLLPALGAFAFAVLATEGLPRFQEPSLPILWACAVAAGERVATRWREPHLAAARR